MSKVIDVRDGANKHGEELARLQAARTGREAWKKWSPYLCFPLALWNGQERAHV